ncbi:MAG TPA: glycosyltransferase [Thermoanaerobaculia bacterium]
MRVLLTNNTLSMRAGSELYVRDVALALLRLGHQPVAYSTRLGEVAEELRTATVPVIDDLAQLAAEPDVIHGHHHLDAMTAMLHFPRVPAIYFCHGWVPWEEMAPQFPTIRRYVAVDDLCQERLQCVHGIVPDKIRIIRNFVDLERFPLRDELPAAPRRALVFSNYLNEQRGLAVLREVCASRGIALDAVGLSTGHSEPQPERVLGQYDIVFAKARCALEALAIGNAVIACDAAGLAGMVTPGNYQELRNLNFGVRSLREPITVENVARALDSYDPRASRAVSLRVRAEAGLGPAIQQILAVYHEALEDYRGSPAEPELLLRSASVYLRQVADFAKGRYIAESERWLAQSQAAAQSRLAEERSQQLQAALAETAQAESERQLAQAQAAAQCRLAEERGQELQAALAEMARAEVDRLCLRENLATVECELVERKAELASIRNSRLGRCMDWIWRWKLRLLGGNGR